MVWFWIACTSGFGIWVYDLWDLGFMDFMVVGLRRSALFTSG